jgi:xylulose-5-phosphate/fructose-6-phosphate phosphoketolase
LNPDELERTIAYWEAANYLTAAQIYLRDNPLLREPLDPEHIKPRLLGHWGTSPGLNLIYAQLNGLIRRTDTEVLYITGPGHGGPAIIANVYLEGTYSEVYPLVSGDEEGLLRLLRQFSTPGGVRQPGPARRLRDRRRRGRDRAPGGIMEGDPVSRSVA